MQRLFSTFPNSWPGAGLLLLRLAAGLCLVGVGTTPGGLGDTAALFLRCASFVVAVALWIGFGTPIAAVTAGVIQVGIMALNHRYDSLAAIGAALAVALAMLGPGAWSLDARLFGRKRIV